MGFDRSENPPFNHAARSIYYSRYSLHDAVRTVRAVFTSVSLAIFEVISYVLGLVYPLFFVVEVENKKVFFSQVKQREETCAHASLKSAQYCKGNSYCSRWIVKYD